MRLRITTLRAASGTGVELLDYRAPRDGRDAPADLRANDIAHWQITMRAAGVAPLLRPSPLFSLVSPDVTALDAAPLAFAEACWSAIPIATPSAWSADGRRNPRPRRHIARSRPSKQQKRPH